MTLNRSALSVIKEAGFNHYGFEKIIKRRFAMLPRHFRRVVNDRYISLFEKSGFRDANLMMLDVVEAAGGLNGLMASSDAELCAYAKKCASEAYTVASRFLIAEMSLFYVRDYAEIKGISPPPDDMPMQGQFARLTCPKWWRRAIRKSIARKVEKFAINLGLVCKQKGIYASDETVSRRQEQKRRNRDLLKTVIAINELGQEFTLEQLSALNVSNPALRRAELMTRIAGFDALAVKHGHIADFYTLTCPSKYHAIGYDGKPNPKYEGFTPKQSQEFLTSTFANLRAYLAKHGVRVYGFRVAEPHHDGTPHWHMILFYEKQYKKFVREAVSAYWLAVDGSEEGAQKYRVKVEAIDRKKGSAAGYLAKYISKNIDAHGLSADDDYEGGEIAKNINRVDAWAACWGIRQFQQIGGAPVGAWREIRRLDAVSDTGLIQDLFNACDAGNWAAYTEIQGGVFVKRKDLKARVNYVFFEEARSLYDGYGLKRIEGLNVLGEEVKTRVHEWFLKRGDLSPSWSSVNNCNQYSESEGENGEILERLNQFVPVKPPLIFDISAGTGIRESETIKQFDIRSFNHG